MLDNCCEDFYLGPASLSSPLSSELSPFTPSGPRGYPCTPSAARRSLPPNRGFRNVLSRIFHRAASVLLPVFCISATLCSHKSRFSHPDCHQQLLIDPVRLLEGLTPEAPHVLDPIRMLISTFSSCGQGACPNPLHMVHPLQSTFKLQHMKFTQIAGNS